MQRKSLLNTRRRRCTVRTRSVVSVCLHGGRGYTVGPPLCWNLFLCVFESLLFYNVTYGTTLFGPVVLSLLLPSGTTPVLRSSRRDSHTVNSTRDSDLLPSRDIRLSCRHGSGTPPLAFGPSRSRLVIPSFSPHLTILDPLHSSISDVILQTRNWLFSGPF